MLLVETAPCSTEGDRLKNVNSIFLSGALCSSPSRVETEPIRHSKRLHTLTIQDLQPD